MGDEGKITEWGGAQQFRELWNFRAGGRLRGHLEANLWTGDRPRSLGFTESCGSEGVSNLTGSLVQELFPERLVGLGTVLSMRNSLANQTDMLFAHVQL